MAAGSQNSGILARLLGQSLARGRLKLTRHIVLGAVDLAALLTVVHLLLGPVVLGFLLLGGCFAAAWRADHYLAARLRRAWRRRAAARRHARR